MNYWRITWQDIFKEPTHKLTKIIHSFLFSEILFIFKQCKSNFLDNEETIYDINFLESFEDIFKNEIIFSFAPFSEHRNIFISDDDSISPNALKCWKESEEYEEVILFFHN